MHKYDDHLYERTIIHLHTCRTIKRNKETTPKPTHGNSHAQHNLQLIFCFVSDDCYYFINHNIEYTEVAEI